MEIEDFEDFDEEFPEEIPEEITPDQPFPQKGLTEKNQEKIKQKRMKFQIYVNWIL